MDLYPKDKVILSDFFQQHKSLSAYDRNLIFTYYMQEILKHDEISVDHIFTCYRTLKDLIPKTPEALVQSLSETINVKGYLIKEGNNYKLTTAGINHLEQKLKFK
ncbi:hypothetical protein [Hymenobacter sp. BT190]|uniref:hypothetical protein n=1 Tax=Hymenobacter sp. BT190 TaxID=2763505 RepID=UPI0016519D4B|nr:hypothetical protein [Hymenobacter sp. BT190]MBC6697171.1 hypothetical protein [Hymenobacter sp. BT190]